MKYFRADWTSWVIGTGLVFAAWPISCTMIRSEQSIQDRLALHAETERESRERARNRAIIDANRARIAELERRIEELESLLAARPDTSPRPDR